jgi:hypothetical protein
MRVLLTALALMVLAFFLNLLGDLSAESSSPLPTAAAGARAAITPARAAAPTRVAAPVVHTPAAAPQRLRRTAAYRVGRAALPSLPLQAAKLAKGEREKLARPSQASREAGRYAAFKTKALAAVEARKHVLLSQCVFARPLREGLGGDQESALDPARPLPPVGEAIQSDRKKH